MTKICQSLIIAASVCAYLCQPVFAQDNAEQGEETEIEVGEGIIDKKAPEFVVDKWFQLPAGKTKASIKDYEGKVLVLLFFQAAGKGNDMALPKMKELFTHYKSNDKVKFLAIQTALDRQLNANSPEEGLRVAKENGFTFPIGHYNWSPNFPGMVTPAGSYKNTHLPWFVVVSGDGIVKFNGVPFKIDVEFAIKEIDKMIK